jgi:hypothetical protein
MQTYHQSIVKFVKSISTIWIPNTIKIAKNVLFLVSQVLPVVQSYFTLCYRMVRVYYRLPISAFFQKCFYRSEVPDMSVDELQLWNCFSYYPAIINFNFLNGQRGTVFWKR